MIYEAAGMAGDGFAPYFLRTLLSEGHLRYETVETPPKGKPKGVVLEREGPTGAILTTTRVKLDPELETRLLSIPVTDSARADQGGDVRAGRRGRRSLRSTSSGSRSSARWRATGGGPPRVTIPFARAARRGDPARSDPPAPRLRRDPRPDPRPRPSSPGHAGVRRARAARSRRSRTTPWCGSWSPT